MERVFPQAKSLTLANIPSLAVTVSAAIQQRATSAANAPLSDDKAQHAVMSVSFLATPI